MGEHEDEARAHERRRRFFVRAAIFITLGAVAQATAALPPGPAEPSFYWASLAVFCVCALSVLPPWRRLPPWGVLWPTLGYLVSVALLLISGGTDPSMQSTAGGLSVLVLLPVLATALSYPRWYSVVVVAGAAFTLTVVGVAVQSSAATDVRRIFLWTAVCVIVATTIHRQRDDLEDGMRDSADLARLGRLMNGATQSLTSLRDPKEVVAQGMRVMNDLVGPGFVPAAYLRVSDGLVREESPAGPGSEPASYALGTIPQFVGWWRRVNLWWPHTTAPRWPRLCAPPSTPPSRGPRLFPSVRAGGSTASSGSGPATPPSPGRSSPAAVPWPTSSSSRWRTRWPIRSSRSKPTPTRSRGCPTVGGCRSISMATGAAVPWGSSSWTSTASRPSTTRTATTSVTRSSSRWPGPRPASCRGGDLLARTGGDEFMAVVADADEADTRRVAERIREAVSRIKVQGVRTTVSIGYACCGKNGDVDRLRQQADEAMYETKYVQRRQHGRHPRSQGDHGFVTGTTEPQLG